MILMNILNLFHDYHFFHMLFKLYYKHLSNHDGKINVHVLFRKFSFIPGNNLAVFKKIYCIYHSLIRYIS
jgi:hypothetical protein